MTVDGDIEAHRIQSNERGLGVLVFRVSTIAIPEFFLRMSGKMNLWKVAKTDLLD